jgi:ArsR family transcriptional regulator
MCAHCYKAASEESRYAILGLLKKGGESSVGALARRTNLTQPTVTHHLKLLQDVGLVRMRKAGRVHYYALKKESECFSECGLLLNL